MTRRKLLRRFLYLIYYGDLEAIRLCMGLVSILISFSFLRPSQIWWIVDNPVFAVIDTTALFAMLFGSGVLRCYYTMAGGAWHSGIVINSAVMAFAWCLTAYGRSVALEMPDATIIPAIISIWILARFWVSGDSYRA